MIEKSMRTFSEKTTSVQHDIEKSQKGIVRMVQRAGREQRVLAIPTIIKTPKILKITPLNWKAAKVFGAAGGWSCDLNLYRASNASVSLALQYSASAGSTFTNVSMYNTLILHDRDLYIGVGAGTSTQSASPSLISGSSSLFKKLDEFSDNEQCYLQVKARSGSAGSTTDIYFAYEVRGY